MKLSKIAKQYNINEFSFVEFLKSKNVKVTEGFWGGYEIPDDSNIDELLSQYAKFKADRDKLIAENHAKAVEMQAKRKEDEERARIEKERCIAQMLITSGFHFDGYTITKYSGYISGDDVAQVDRGSVGIFSSATNVGASLTNALVKIRRQALLELKEAAYALGCNAVIGVDFDYITLEPETANYTGGTTYLPYVFCVTANGNAVVIEKNKE